MFDKLIEALPSVLSRLTLLRTLYTIIIAVFFTILYSGYLERQSIINSMLLSNIDTRTVSIAQVDAVTLARAKDVVKRSQLLVAIQVVAVSLPTNTRSSVMFVADTDRFQNAFETGLSQRLIPIPLLNNDITNNMRFQTILNGRFVCSPIEQTSMFDIVPAIHTYAIIVCSVSIPPYTGKFAGYLNVYLDAVPTEDQLTSIETIARMFSSEVYTKELSRQ